jgi:hypothetical protein
MGALSLLRRLATGRNPSPDCAEWLAPADGDAVIFDPRVIHTGSHSVGPKYSLFLAYGIPGSHAAHHAMYYRFMRPDLGYQPMHIDLVGRLKAASLYQELEFNGAPISGANRPRPIQSLIGRRIRHSIAQKQIHAEAKQ